MNVDKLQYLEINSLDDTAVIPGPRGIAEMTGLRDTLLKWQPDLHLPYYPSHFLPYLSSRPRADRLQGLGLGGSKEQSELRQKVWSAMSARAKRCTMGAGLCTETLYGRHGPSCSQSPSGVTMMISPIFINAATEAEGE